MSASNPNVYNQVVNITHDYLGPAAERFISRQVLSHLSKPPEDLTATDLKKLIDWIRIAISLLTADSDVVEEYIEKLEKLCTKRAKSKGDKRGKS